MEAKSVLAVNLTHKRSTVFGLIARLFMFLCGVLGILMSIVTFFTVIGIPIGIFMWIGACAMLYGALGRQQVTCPVCNHKRNYVRNHALNFKCVKCKTFMVINWMDRDQ